MLTRWKESCEKHRQHIKNQRHHFANKGPYSPNYMDLLLISPVVMYKCESWTIKKAEHPRTDAFELWCWRRHLRVPWTARRSNQSILQKTNPEYSLEGLMLKLQYFGYLMWTAVSLEKSLMLGRTEGRRGDRGRDGWMASPTQRIWVWVKSRSWWWTGRPGVLWFMGSQRAGHDWATELNWTELKWLNSNSLGEIDWYWTIACWT